MPWSLYCYIQQHGKQKIYTLGFHLSHFYDFLSDYLYSHRWVIFLELIVIYSVIIYNYKYFPVSFWVLNKRLTLCCNMAGVFGFLTFGREVASDILMSYPGNDVVMIIARLLFGISIITIYPIILLLGRYRKPQINVHGSLYTHCVHTLMCQWLRLVHRSVILTQILRFWERRAIITSVFESRCRLILTILWITVTLLIAICVPDMSEVISVIGGISAFFIFIFPGETLK